MSNLIAITINATPQQLFEIAKIMVGDTVAISGGDVTEPIAEIDKDGGVTIKTENVPVSGDVVITDNTPPPPPEDDKTLPPSTADVLLDSGGMPWDVRIHASTKTQKADGTWKRKVRVSNELVVEVEAELRAAMAATPVSDPAAALANAGNAGTPVNTSTSGEGGEATPPPPEDLPPAGKPTNFPELLPLVTTAKANGTISDDQIAVAVAAVGLTKFGELALRPDLIPQFAEAAGV